MSVDQTLKEEKLRMTQENQNPIAIYEGLIKRVEVRLIPVKTRYG